jgi:hypothetical protein
LSAFLFPFGAPGDGPPCIRQRPFGIAGDRHGLPFLVRALHRLLRCRVQPSEQGELRRAAMQAADKILKIVDEEKRKLRPHYSKHNKAFLILCAQPDFARHLFSKGLAAANLRKIAERLLEEMKSRPLKDALGNAIEANLQKIFKRADEMERSERAATLLGK